MREPDHPLQGLGPCWRSLAVLLLLTLGGASLVAAQTRASRWPMTHARRAAWKSFTEPVDSRPLEIRSLPSSTVPASGRNSVNLNLLLPRRNQRHSWISGNDVALRGREIAAASVFASAAPKPAPDNSARFNDPQFYTRRIPGVGPIVHRILEESKAHPRLTRVLQSLQPQF